MIQKQKNKKIIKWHQKKRKMIKRIHKQYLNNKTNSYKNNKQQKSKPNNWSRNNLLI